jgi:poly(A) polymerase
MERDYSKITPADAPWLTKPSARAVCDVIAAAGHQIFYVGGCVRNALLGCAASDVDLSTSATPTEVTALAQAAGLRAIPTGIEHGTVTIVADGTPYEVTTFRRDVETDGRRAVVAFSGDIIDDARRRDFTMNAIYADPDGLIVDPLGGMKDLRARRVRFIENADLRIQEDYLRTLRYFRFFAWYGDTAQGLDADALAAISGNLDGIETLSAERIGAEFCKLLAAPDPSQAVAAMAQTGVLGTVLSGADPRFFFLMVHGEQAISAVPDWIGRLVALGGDSPSERLRLSKQEQRRYTRIRAAAFEGTSLSQTALEHGSDIAAQAYLIRCAVAESLPEDAVVAQLQHAARQVFPISADDLMPAYAGPALGARLAELKSAWIASEFSLGKAELLALPSRQ